MEFWLEWLSETGLEAPQVSVYAKLFVENEMTQEDVGLIDHELLSSMGIKVAKHRLLILKHKKRELAAVNKKTSVAAVDDMQAKIIAHLKHTQMDEAKFLEWASSAWELCSRDVLVEKLYLLTEAPKQGTAVISDAFRTGGGQKLLFEAKAMLWAALYGEADMHVKLERVERELLALTVPVKKAHVFNFFESVTQIGVSGTWRDPDNVSSDENAANMVLQVEYGEVASELIGDTVMVCILLINLLQVNEEILYATSTNVEQSTLKIQVHFKSSKLKAQQ